MMAIESKFLPNPRRSQAEGRSRSPRTQLAAFVLGLWFLSLLSEPSRFDKEDMAVTIVRFRTALPDLGQFSIPSDPVKRKKKKLLVEQKIGHKVAVFLGIELNRLARRAAGINLAVALRH